jgi:hypothetical protein
MEEVPLIVVRELEEREVECPSELKEQEGMGGVPLTVVPQVEE